MLFLFTSILSNSFLELDDMCRYSDRIEFVSMCLDIGVKGGFKHKYKDQKLLLIEVDRRRAHHKNL